MKSYDEIRSFLELGYLSFIERPGRWTELVLSTYSGSLGVTDAYFFTKGFQTSAFVCFCRNLSPRSNQLSDNSTSNKQTLYEELLTMSFNRLSYQSLTSRKNCEMHSKS